MALPPWLPFWRGDAWRDWRRRRGDWAEYVAARRPADRRPPRPVSPAWLPAGVLVTVAVMAGGGTGSPGPLPEATGSTAGTATSTPLPTTTEGSSSPTPTPTATAAPPVSTPAPTTTPRATPSSEAPPGDPLFALPAPGPSGDPGAALPAGATPVTVVAITDGDTLEVARPDGSRFPVRLIGTNTPEQDECFAEEAARVLEVLAPIGGVVGLTRDESDRDQFGRALRYVWQGGMSVNEETVRRGAAIARRYEPDAAMADRLDAAQAAAQRAARGLWAPDACGTPADADLSIVDVHYDAPGDDTTSLNQEWVLVRNDGDNLVDLTGWVLKDESASHRYAFPAGFTLAGDEEVRVLTGCGPDFGTRLHWCNRGSAVWNNDGDTAFLLDPAGNTHDTFAYDG